MLLKKFKVHNICSLWYFILGVFCIYVFEGKVCGSRIPRKDLLNSFDVLLLEVLTIKIEVEVQNATMIIVVVA